MKIDEIVFARSVTSQSRPDFHGLVAKWYSDLPERWRGMVEYPVYFEHYAEYEMLARRGLGYDQCDKPCFVHHQYSLTNLMLDDDENWIEAIVYAEEMSAWRMTDERWLIYRIIKNSESGAKSQSFYAFSQDMPR